MEDHCHPSALDLARLAGLAPEAWGLLLARLGLADLALALRDAPSPVKLALKSGVGWEDWKSLEPMLLRAHDPDSEQAAQMRLARALGAMISAGTIAEPAPIPDIPAITSRAASPETPAIETVRQTPPVAPAPEPIPAEPPALEAVEPPLAAEPLDEPAAAAPQAPSLSPAAIALIEGAEARIEELERRAREAAGANAQLMAALRAREIAHKELEAEVRSLEERRRSEDFDARGQREADAKRLEDLQKKIEELESAKGFEQKLAEARSRLGEQAARLGERLDGLEQRLAEGLEKGRAEVERQIDALGPAMEAWIKQELEKERAKNEASLQASLTELTEQLAFVSRLAAKIEQVRTEAVEGQQGMRGELETLSKTFKTQEEALAGALDDIRAAVLLDLHARYAASQAAWQKALQQVSAQAALQSELLASLDERMKTLGVDALAGAVESSRREWEALAQQARHSIFYWEARAKQELDGRDIASRLLRLESRLRVLEARSRAEIGL